MLFRSVPTLHMASVYTMLSEFPDAKQVANAHLTRLTNLLSESSKGRYGKETEKSRSGRGVHILMRGKLPFSGKNNLAGLEIYQARRFFIMTGKVLIFPEIIDNQEAIDYVVEKYFKETEKTGSNSNMVQRIYSPKFPKPTGGRIFVRPDYPEIPDGGRNISLTSLAGALHNTGYTPMQIYQE